MSSTAMADNWLKDDEQVKDYIADPGGLYEGEGLEDAFWQWKALPKERRTEAELNTIIDKTGYADIDLYDPPSWMPRV